MDESQACKRSLTLKWHINARNIFGEHPCLECSRRCARPTRTFPEPAQRKASVQLPREFDEYRGSVAGSQPPPILFSCDMKTPGNRGVCNQQVVGSNPSAGSISKALLTSPFYKDPRPRALMRVFALGHFLDTFLRPVRVPLLSKFKGDRAGSQQPPPLEIPSGRLMSLTQKIPPLSAARLMEGSGCFQFPQKLTMLRLRRCASYSHPHTISELLRLDSLCSPPLSAPKLRPHSGRARTPAAPALRLRCNRFLDRFVF